IAEGGLTVDLVESFAAVTDFFGIGAEIWREDDPAAALQRLVAPLGELVIGIRQDVPGMAGRDKARHCLAPARVRRSPCTPVSPRPRDARARPGGGGATGPSAGRG